MPFDQKRINGPEISFSYKPFVVPTVSKETADLAGERYDGRDISEHRKIAVQLSAISKAKGSCYLELGETKVICSASELREIPRINKKYADKGQLFCDFKYAPFARENRNSIGENEEKLIASNIKSALESAVCLHDFPNYQIDVFILVLADDGSVLSASIMAAGLAFVDASIPIYDLISSSTVAVVDEKLLIDPSDAEEESVNNSFSRNDIGNHGTITISTLSTMEQISQILLSGFIEPKLLKDAKNQLTEINKTHVNYLKKIISKKIMLAYIEP